MPKKAKTYKGKSLKAGGGGKFARMVDALKRKGKSAFAAKAIAAAAGRAKYGKAKMRKWASAGKRRASKKRKSGGSKKSRR